MLLHKSIYLFETVNVRHLFVCLFVCLLSFYPVLGKLKYNIPVKWHLEDWPYLYTQVKQEEKPSQWSNQSVLVLPPFFVNSDRASLWNSVFVQCCIFNRQLTKSYKSKRVKTVTVCTIIFVATDLCLRCSSPLPHIHEDSAEVVLLMLWIRP